MNSLQEQISEYKKEFSQKAPAEVQKLMETKNQELEESGILKSTLNVGDKIPDIELSNANGESVSVNSIYLNKPIVLSFYRGGWCPYCNLELSALQQALPEIEKAGGVLVAISPEQPDTSLRHLIYPSNCCDICR